MSVLLARRLVTLILTLLVASAVVFFVLEVLPGDPAAVMLGVNAREDTLAALRAEMGLDRPAIEQRARTAWTGSELDVADVPVGGAPDAVEVGDPVQRQR